MWALKVPVCLIFWMGLVACNAEPAPPAPVEGTELLERLVTGKSRPLFSSGKWLPAHQVFSTVQFHLVEVDLKAAVLVAQSLRSCPLNWVFQPEFQNLPSQIQRRRGSATFPPAHFIFDLFRSTQLAAARDVLVALLSNSLCEVNLSYAPPGSTPLLLQVLQFSYRDVVLVQPLLLDYAHRVSASSRSTTAGLSILHVLSSGGPEPLEVAKELLTVAAKLASGNVDCVSGAYQAMTAEGEATGSSTSLANVYSSSMNTSPSFRALVQEWDGKAAHVCTSDGESFFGSVEVTWPVATQIGEDFFLSYVEALATVNGTSTARSARGTNSIVDSIHALIPASRRNILHVFVLKNWHHAVLRWRDWTTLGLSSKYSVLTALLEKEKYFQATPLHLAARRESSGACQSDMFASLLALLATALAKPDSDPNDALTDQKTMHVDETSHLVQRLQVALKSLRSRVTTALGKRIVQLPTNKLHLLSAFFEIDTDEWVSTANTRPVHHVPSPLKVIELQHLPDEATFQDLLRSGHVFIIRGGAKQFPRLVKHAFSQWTAAQLKSQFGDSMVEVAVVPYIADHIQKQTMTLREFLDSAGPTCSTIGSVDSSSTKYLFSTAFAPSLMSNASDIETYLRAVAGRELLIEAGSGQMKTHFFAGGQNSGSPVHFHALAVNVVAWGRKEWWVAPVRKSFYTNEPAAVRRARIAAQAIESGMPTSSSSEFTHFVQNALDIVVIPTDVAHTTLNSEFTVGMAIEVTHLAAAPW
eukprot:INCI9869.1.p1 GENE.INCI9869.1~~INCI9869.1.p1  ORF type:complete len:755 (-),score=123.60 INCI9869.1:97-2361(-)